MVKNLEKCIKEKIVNFRLDTFKDTLGKSH